MMMAKSGYFCKRRCSESSAVNRIYVSTEAETITDPWVCGLETMANGRLFRLRTDNPAGVIVVEDAERDGRKNARKVQEERCRYRLVQRIGADESYARIQVDCSARNTV